MVVISKHSCLECIWAWKRVSALLPRYMYARQNRIGQILRSVLIGPALWSPAIRPGALWQPTLRTKAPGGVAFGLVLVSPNIPTPGLRNRIRGASNRVLELALTSLLLR